MQTGFCPYEDTNRHYLNFKELFLEKQKNIMIYDPTDDIDFCITEKLIYYKTSIPQIVKLSPKLLEIYPRVKAELENLMEIGEDSIISDETAEFIKLIYNTFKLRESEIQEILDREVDVISTKSANSS